MTHEGSYDTTTVSRLQRAQGAIRSTGGYAWLGTNKQTTGFASNQLWQWKDAGLNHLFPDAVRSRSKVQDILSTDASRGSALGYSLALLAADIADDPIRRWKSAPIVYCSVGRTEHDDGVFHGWGLQQFGLSPERFILLRCHKPKDLWFALEETLSCTAVAGVIADLDAASSAKTDNRVGRRLNLACEAAQRPLLMIRSENQGVMPTAWNSWRVASAPSAELQAPQWSVELLRSKSGAVPLTTKVTWDAKRHRLHLATELADDRLDPAYEPSGADIIQFAKAAS